MAIIKIHHERVRRGEPRPLAGRSDTDFAWGDHAITLDELRTFPPTDPSYSWDPDPHLLINATRRRTRATSRRGATGDPIARAAA